MKNQFFYTEKVNIAPKADMEPIYQTKINSFNINRVVRTIMLDDGGVLVLLDDIHDRTEQVRKMKNGKISFVKETYTVQSEIRLSKEDGKRFKDLTEY